MRSSIKNDQQCKEKEKQNTEDKSISQWHTALPVLFEYLLSKNRKNKDSKKIIAPYKAIQSRKRFPPLQRENHLPATGWADNPVFTLSRV